MTEPRGRVWLEVDLATLCDNYRKIRDTVEPCEVMAVLKANAYGLGVERVARSLAEAGGEALRRGRVERGSDPRQ